MDEDYISVLKEAFGESSSSDTESEHNFFEAQLKSHQPNSHLQSHLLAPETLPTWERVPEINGLWLCRDLFSIDQQSHLLSAIESEGWFTEASHNQAMRFGDLPEWATELADVIHEALLMSDQSASIFQSNILWREPLFDQMIVNMYQPGHLCTC